MQSARPSNPKQLGPSDQPNHSARLVLGLLKKLRQTMRRLVDAEMAKYNLTEAQWAPLWIMETTGACTAGELAREMSIDAGSVTRLLDRLTEKGFVQRARSPLDRRILTVELTPAGRKAIKHIPGALALANEQVLHGFSDEERDMVLTMFSRILANGGVCSGEPSSVRARKAGST